MNFQRIKDFFLNDLFAGFSDYSNHDNLVFWLFTFGAFLLGYFISAFFAGRIKRRLRKELKDVRHELNNTKAELAALQEQHELKTAALQKAELTVEDLSNRIEVLESEKSQLHTDLYNANEEVEKLNASTQSYASTVDDLNNQIIGLKTKSNEYAAELEANANSSIDGEAAAQISEMQTNYNSTLDRLVALEAKLNQLDTENEMLKADLDKMKSSTKLVMSEPAPVVEEESVAPRIIKAEAGAAPLKERVVLTPQQARVKGLVGTSILAAGEGKRDDLTLINGVGPFLEKKLNNIGIYTYEQISGLNAETIVEITEAIEFFPGRIEKDDWVGQANRLLGRGGNTNRRARVAVPAIKEVTNVIITDDLSTEEAATTEEIELEMLAKETTTAIEDTSNEVPEEAMEISDLELSPEETITNVEGAAEGIILGSRSTEEVAEEITEEAAVEEAPPAFNPFSKYKKDDLKIVEGIGPKISIVLTNAGLYTWQKLADTKAEDLKKILAKAGNRFKIHDPSTWPQQAEFAAKGNWTKLKEYQDYLVGGKDVVG